MRTKVILYLVGLVFLSACSSGLKSGEQLTCDALFTSWKSTDLSEANNYLYLSVGQLGDNSISSKVLLENKNAAEFLKQSMSVEKDSDPELRKLVDDLSATWGEAYENGRNLMWSLIISSREQKPALDDRQMSWSLKASLKMIEAGTIGIKIRGKCLEMGYSGKK